LLAICRRGKTRASQCGTDKSSRRAETVDLPVAQRGLRDRETRRHIAMKEIIRERYNAENIKKNTTRNMDTGQIGDRPDR